MNRHPLTLFGLVCVALALVVATGLIMSSAPVAALIASGQSASPASSRDSYRGIPAGLTEDGHPYLGQPDAPVTVEEYTDFLCPFCARHATQTLPGLLDKHVATGQVKYVFRDMPLASLHPTAAKGHAAARCVAEQGAPLFWAMEAELFKNQTQWSQLADPADYLAGVAKAVGADSAAYGQCVASGRMDGTVQQNVASGQALGFNGTPSFRFTEKASGQSYNLVGAQPLETFTQWIDAMVAGKAPAQQAEQPKAEPQELPFWASQGLAPDPKRPGFNMAGDPFRGSPQAKLVVVEFSNFQCPSCKQHELEVQPGIDEALVKSGQVMWVFKNLPLRSLPQSTVAAVAAECAGDQGRYWDMHRQLFETQSQWAIDSPDASLTDLAGELGLDKGQFAACLNSRQPLERVVSDLFDAQGVASSTPTFVALYGGKGSVVRGSRPADQFVTLLQGLMKPAGS